jgi:hypothetical protein
MDGQAHTSRGCGGLTRCWGHNAYDDHCLRYVLLYYQSFVLVETYDLSGRMIGSFNGYYKFDADAAASSFQASINECA